MIPLFLFSSIVHCAGVGVNYLKISERMIEVGQAQNDNAPSHLPVDTALSVIRQRLAKPIHTCTLLVVLWAFITSLFAATSSWLNDPAEWMHVHVRFANQKTSSCSCSIAVLWFRFADVMLRQQLHTELQIANDRVLELV